MASIVVAEGTDVDVDEIVAVVAVVPTELGTNDDVVWLDIDGGVVTVSEDDVVTVVDAVGVVACGVVVTVNEV